jgi:mRNA interferase RelE/StbE
VSRYVVYVTPAAWNDITSLAARFRHRVRDAVEAFAENPRPPKSKVLTIRELPLEVRRLRLERWRILYAIMESEKAVDVLAVRKRPPYDYGDLESLLEEYRTP